MYSTKTALALLLSFSVMMPFSSVNAEDTRYTRTGVPAAMAPMEKVCLEPTWQTVLALFQKKNF